MILKLSNYINRPRYQPFLTIQELLSAEPKQKSDVWFTKNGISFNRAVVLGVCERTFSKESFASAIIVDQYRDVLHIVVFGEHMPIVESMVTNEYYIVSGYVDYNTNKDYFILVPNMVEKVDKNVVRLWYLNIAKNRIESGLSLPKYPFEKILKDEGIEFEVLEDNEWLFVKKPKEETIDLTKEEKAILSFLKEKKEANLMDCINYANDKFGISLLDTTKLIEELVKKNIVIHENDKIRVT